MGAGFWLLIVRKVLSLVAMFVDLGMDYWIAYNYATNVTDGECLQHSDSYEGLYVNNGGGEDGEDVVGAL